MTTVIVPIAGPDMYSAEGLPRVLLDLGGEMLIERILRNRPWVKELEAGDDLVFVIRKYQTFHARLEEEIRDLFPNSKIVTLEGVTKGSLLSSFIGAASIQAWHSPVVIDLADINFECELGVHQIFEDQGVYGAIPFFYSQLPVYSYIMTEEGSGNVLLAREKLVISNKASAGVYFFRDFYSYLDCLHWAVKNPDKSTHKDSYFVCPSFNGLIEQGKIVKSFKVHNVESYSKDFHAAD